MTLRGANPKRIGLTRLVVGALALSATIGIGGGLGSPGSGDSAAAASPSVDDAYAFLNHMMDLYATGSAPRLVQSFTGGSLGQSGFTDSETYDDALMIDAYLAEGTADGMSRAQIIGTSLLLAQSHDPAHDGRIRAAYAPIPLETTSKRGKPRIKVHLRDRTSDVGNMAWVGMALVRLYADTGNAAYLNGAQAIGTWVVKHCYDTRGAGGFTGGLTSSGARIKWKSTEHNIDLYGLYTMLASETHNASWTADAAWARRFVDAMWEGATASFYVGTTTNGVTPNTAEQPEDVNSWSYLAFRDPTYAASVDWDVTNLSVSSGGFAGVSFCLGDRSGVWFEGTAHLADALEVRQASGDVTRADQYLSDIAYAQTNGPNADGLGIVAASKDGLSDCDGDFYYASLHTGATSWYVLAAQQVNPFVL
jgi:hypothetical protein